MRTLVLTAGLLLGHAWPALAHEKGVIRLESKTLPIGGDLVMRGEKLPKSATLRLQLRGVLASFQLGEVKTDSAGAFQLRLALPADARAGSYSLLAIASDGDRAAQTDLVVTAGPAPSAATPMPAMGAHAGMSRRVYTAGSHLTAEMMKVDAHTSGAEKLVMIALIGLGLVGGVGLLAGARKADTK